MTDLPRPTARARWIDPDFRRTARTERYCCACGRDLAPGRAARAVALMDSCWAVHPDDVEAIAAGAEVRSDPDGALLEPEGPPEPALLGLDCARRIGLEWSRPA